MYRWVMRAALHLRVDRTGRLRGILGRTFNLDGVITAPSVIPNKTAFRASRLLGGSPTDWNNRKFRVYQEISLPTDPAWYDEEVERPRRTSEHPWLDFERMRLAVESIEVSDYVDVEKLEAHTYTY